MKKQIKYGIILAICALLVSCTTLYTSVITVTEVVDSGMKQWAQANKARQTTPEFNLQVVRLHDNYRAAAAAAQFSLKAYQASGNATMLVTALQQAKDGAAPLIQFIVTILLPPQADALTTQLAKATKP
jgi:Na+-translocating ferredoxin:NAD+ oxidoreductase RnfG subunit